MGDVLAPARNDNTAACPGATGPGKEVMLSAAVAPSLLEKYRTASVGTIDAQAVFATRLSGPGAPAAELSLPACLARTRVAVSGPS